MSLCVCVCLCVFLWTIKCQQFQYCNFNINRKLARNLESLASKREIPGNLRNLHIAPFPAAAKHKNKHTCCIHPGWGKSRNRRILHLSTRSSPADTMHLASHVSCHYTPLSPLTEGRGTVTDLSSVHQKGTTDNFAFEGLNMQERPNWVRAQGGAPLCDLLSNPYMRTHSHIHKNTLPSSNRWEDVSKCEEWAPPALSTTLTTEDSWEADIPSSQLSEENKERVGPLLHTRACVQKPPCPQKSVNSTVGWSYFSLMGLPDSRGVTAEPETFAEGEWKSGRSSWPCPCWHTHTLILLVRQGHFKMQHNITLYNKDKIS